MRKLLFTLLLACLFVMARGQTVLYWFDGYSGPATSATLTGGTVKVDASGLTDGLHALHVQCMLDNGSTTPIATRYFLRVRELDVVGGTEAIYWFDGYSGLAKRADVINGAVEVDASELADGLHALHLQCQLPDGTRTYISTRYFIRVRELEVAEGVKAVYWFDDQSGQALTAPVVGGTVEVNATELADGLHALHLQCQLPDGTRTYIATRYFIRVRELEVVEGVKAVYWFDDQSGQALTAPVVDGTVEVNASALADGLHTLHLQCILGDGSSSYTTNRYFLRVSQHDVATGSEVVYWFDDQTDDVKRTPMTEGMLEIDASGLDDGLHALHLQCLLSDGSSTYVATRFFLRVSPQAETLRCLYRIDDDTEVKDMGTISPGATVPFDLDVSELSNGLHSITYILDCGKGGSRIARRFFIKIPVGGNKLTKYQYWVNDNVDKVRTTEVNPNQNPLQLTDLLPVESCPLRSELFHFEFKNGQPMMYAKNTLKARFYDRYDHFTTVEENYVDNSVSAPVVVSGVLTPNESETTEWPAANTVKWYTLVAERGDSLRLKLSCAATIQLFAPSGEEVYKADGAEAVKWGGLHVKESGTFYVALHDVTATRGNTITIDYQHFDRYAILQQDVRIVGNGGPSTINFEGNGFDELQWVKLIKDDATITSVEVVNDGKAQVAVKFDFTRAELGTYKAVFHFIDGNKEVASCVTVVEAEPSSYQATASYASQFLISRGNDYNFKIRNLGNMSAYDVPMTILIYTPDKASLKGVSSKNLILGSFTEDFASPDIEGFPYKRTYSFSRTLPPSSAEAFTVHVNTTETVYVYLVAEGTRAGGPSTPVTSLDPNDIYGYQDDKGDKTIRNGLTQVYYTIEFENDPEFATAPAHDIYVTDVLDPTLFDLTTFAPTRVKVGAKEVELDGSKNGSVTFSMLPEIYAIAQLDWSLDETTGKVSWHISSLDPMTIEPTEELTSGVLPVNTDGNGTGELSFDIQLKPNLPDGTKVENKATIVFDENDPITTPAWVNTVDSRPKGDVNGDGKVTVTDAALVLEKAHGNTPEGFIESAADMNGDGKVTEKDAVLILDMILTQ